MELGQGMEILVEWELFLVSGGFELYSGTDWMWKFGDGRNIYSCE